MSFGVRIIQCNYFLEFVRITLVASFRFTLQQITLTSALTFGQRSLADQTVSSLTGRNVHIATQKSSSLGGGLFVVVGWGFCGFLFVFL